MPVPSEGSELGAAATVVGLPVVVADVDAGAVAVADGTVLTEVLGEGVLDADRVAAGVDPPTG
ncbi:MAG TPA: hypothetical protein VFI44_04995, partial [Ornithinibacter sp.]|nr:hypothetical protein [Ornithinibacter sp.]